MNTLDLRQLIGSANEDAAQFFRAQLLARQAEGPRSYLIDRGFTAVLGSTRWTVGYAPDSWTALHDHLSNLGYSDHTLLDAGLITISRRGTPIDRMRNRVTFGIRDADFTLVGFTARAAPTAPSGTPKYMNAPRTAAYDKSASLIGIGEAKLNPASEATVVVEGPLDALAVSLVGEGRWTPVAMCGTALTEVHAQAIARLAQPAVLALDDDAAGRRALEPAVARLTRHAGEPLAARLPHGQDPCAVFCDQGAGNLQSALECAVPASELVLSRILASWGDTSGNAERTLCCVREATRALARMAPPDVARHIAHLSRTLQLSPETVSRELAAAASLNATDSRIEPTAIAPSSAALMRPQSFRPTRLRR